MNKFSWYKAIGFGILLWAIMAIALWILGTISSLSPLWAHGIVAALGAISGFLVASTNKPSNGAEAAGYGLVWASIIVALDIVFTQWFDAHIFASWQYWLGPALVFLSPWVQTEARQAITESHQV